MHERERERERERETDRQTDRQTKTERQRNFDRIIENSQSQTSRNAAVTYCGASCS